MSGKAELARLWIAHELGAAELRIDSVRVTITTHETELDSGYRSTVEQTTYSVYVVAHIQAAASSEPGRAFSHARPVTSLDELAVDQVLDGASKAIATAAWRHFA